MYVDEITLILVLVNILISMWTIRVLSLAVQNGLNTVLSSLHSRLDEILSGGGSDFEPPNEIRAAIGQMLTQRFSAATNLPEMTRTESGKFSGEKIS